MATTTWDNVYVAVQAKLLTAEKHFEVRLHVEDDDNYATLIVWPNTTPHLPAGTWELREVVATVSTLLDSGDLDQFDLDVYYFWRFLYKVEGANVVYQAFQDENLLTYQVKAQAFIADVGSIALVTEAGGTVHVNKVKVSDFPMPFDFIGPA